MSARVTYNAIMHRALADKLETTCATRRRHRTESLGLLLATIVITLLSAACSSTSKTSHVDTAALRRGEWRLVSMDGAAVSDSPRVTLQFMDERKLGGR